MPRLVIGTRGSALALWQAETVKAALLAAHTDLEVDLKIIRTQGDQVLNLPLSRLGDKGAFTKELEGALLEGDIDLAVHSCKDLPTILPDGLAIGAYLKRHDPRDVVVSAYGAREHWPNGIVVGSSSLRRRAQLLRWRPHLQVADVRGNIDTRLKKLDEGQYGALVLAGAGLSRLGFGDRIAEWLSIDEFLPAVAQGAIAVEVRDGELAHWLDPLNHEATALTVRAERAWLRTIEGGCRIPQGAHAVWDGNRLILRAQILSLDGREVVDDALEGIEPIRLGEALGRRMLERGGREILGGIPRS